MKSAIQIPKTLCLAVSVLAISLATADLCFAQTDNSQAKVYGMHMILLEPGVTGEQFERFFVEQVYPNWKVPGWEVSLLKGDRGDREGRYLVLFEIDSVELRDRYAPEHDTLSEELQQHLEPLEEVLEEWQQLASVPGESTIYTDYYVVER